ncbi:hypothetical protein Mgra_00007686 [Meloidogyne graminicola]|uniref:Uncharacterized protein n=1 Tax=Meloidogyne graminicola TaxID=189291 RepID=A0A8S9ZI14_9BILA|nr:hypothetical protein Mgra_00007686 [Meloidogyne graminicola]
MWWKKLWCPVLCTTLFWGDMHISGPFNKFETDRWFKRYFVGHDRIMTYLRDIHMTGDEYILNDLFSISEED